MTTPTRPAVAGRPPPMLLTRRYSAEYARRPLNLVLLAVVPMVS